MKRNKILNTDPAKKKENLDLQETFSRVPAEKIGMYLLSTTLKSLLHRYSDLSAIGTNLEI